MLEALNKDTSHAYTTDGGALRASQLLVKFVSRLGYLRFRRIYRFRGSIGKRPFIQLLTPPPLGPGLPK